MFKEIRIILSEPSTVGLAGPPSFHRCCSLCWKGLLLNTAAMGKREPLAPRLRVSGREGEDRGRGWQGARDREGRGGRWEAGGAPRHRRCGPVRCEGAWAGGRGRAWCRGGSVRMERSGGLGVVEGRGCCEVCGSPARCRCRSSSPRPRLGRARLPLGSSEALWLPLCCADRRAGRWGGLVVLGKPPGLAFWLAAWARAARL